MGENKDTDIQSVTDVKKPETTGSVIKEVFSFFLYLAVILLLTFLMLHFVGQRTVVNGHSMETTLQDHDSLIIDKLSYRFKDPERFDIIVFPYQYAEDTYYIKRIIGLPGETVFIDDEGTIYIDGQELKEGYGREIIEDPGRAAEPIELGPDEYFVLGDNRNESEDSRFSDVAEIKRDIILGKAFVRIFPFNNFTLLDHDYNNKAIVEN
ncbi:MAG: signal peptidase I [Lachnospiraceae bacterium]|nr:signal peptidase I [Lachnospiraceae bacterium]